MVDKIKTALFKSMFKLKKLNLQLVGFLLLSQKNTQGRRHTKQDEIALNLTHCRLWIQIRQDAEIHVVEIL